MRKSITPKFVTPDSEGILQFEASQIAKAHFEANLQNPGSQIQQCFFISVFRLREEEPSFPARDASETRKISKKDRNVHKVREDLFLKFDEVSRSISSGKSGEP